LILINFCSLSEKPGRKLQNSTTSCCYLT